MFHFSLASISLVSGAIVVMTALRGNDFLQLESAQNRQLG